MQESFGFRSLPLNLIFRALNTIFTVFPSSRRLHCSVPQVSLWLTNVWLDRATYLSSHQPTCQDHSAKSCGCSKAEVIRPSRGPSLPAHCPASKPKSTAVLSCKPVFIINQSFS